MRSQRKEGSDVQDQRNRVRNTDNEMEVVADWGEGEVASSAVGSSNTVNFNMHLAVSGFAPVGNKANWNDL